MNSSNKGLSASYPGPQREIKRFFSRALFLRLLAFVTFFLLFQTVVRENKQELGVPPVHIGTVDIWSINLMNSGSAAALIVGILSLMFVNRQVVLAYRPVFNYRSQQTHDSIFALQRDNHGGPFWQVKLQNVASGPAIALRSYYRVSFQSDCLGSYQSYAEVVRQLGEAGIVNGEDFVLRYISNGWCLASKDECVILEMTLSSAQKLYAFDVAIEFQGLLGDQYVKTVYCVPRMGIYPRNPHAPMVEQSKAQA